MIFSFHRAKKVNKHISRKVELKMILKMKIGLFFTAFGTSSVRWASDLNITSSFGLMTRVEEFHSTLSWVKK